MYFIFEVKSCPIDSWTPFQYLCNYRVYKVTWPILYIVATLESLNERWLQIEWNFVLLLFGIEKERRNDVQLAGLANKIIRIHVEPPHLIKYRQSRHVSECLASLFCVSVLYTVLWLDTFYAGRDNDEFWFYYKQQNLDCSRFSYACMDRRSVRDFPVLIYALAWEEGKREIHAIPGLSANTACNMIFSSASTPITGVNRRLPEQLL